MALWGRTSADADKPKWLTDAQKADTELTEAGWVFTQPNGTKELLVALGDADTTVPDTAPVNTVLPAITGTPTVGQTLTVSNGTWTGSPTPTYTRQWKRNGTNIASATGTTYVLVVADEDATITCTVTATNSAGNANVTSAGVGPVVAA